MKTKVKKIALFTFVAAILVAAVVLLIKYITPEPKLDSAFYCSYNYCENQDVSACQDYITDILIDLNYVKNNKPDLSEADIAKLDADILFFNNSFYILKASDDIIYSMQSGLLFNSRSKNFNDLAKKLENHNNKYFKECSSTKTYFNSYYSIFSDSKSSMSFNDSQRYFDAIKNHYQKLIELNSILINSYTNIFIDSSKMTLENNGAVFANYMFLAEYCNNVCEQVDTCDTSKTNKFYSQSQKYFTDCSSVEANALFKTAKKIDFSEFVNQYLSGTINAYIAELDYASEAQNFLESLVEA